MIASTGDIVIPRGAAAAWCAKCTKRHRHRHDCTTKIMEAIGILAETERISYAEAADRIEREKNNTRRFACDAPQYELVEEMQ